MSLKDWHLRFPGTWFLVFCLPVMLTGHQPVPVTHQFHEAKVKTASQLTVNVVDADTGKPIAARLSFVVDGAPYTPPWVDEHGIRFTSIHVRAKNRFTTIYSKGEGPVTVGIPAQASNVVVSATRGFEYRVRQEQGRVIKGKAAVTIKLSRWINLEKEGWVSVDEHLHFDRLDPEDDKLWLSMLDADGLVAGHFMVLKGGMVPGIWSRQFAYGSEGIGQDGQRILVPGQEYRDSAQGHINLLGIQKVIEPYSTGGMGTPQVDENFPPLFNVLSEAQAQGGFTGVAHGGTLGKHPTAIADAVLGAVDFWELSNGFIYSTDIWYQLLNCGFSLPPAAGTDLPNSPYRDSWQPFFGSIRTYVYTDGKRDFESFKEGMKRGQVFISGSPVIDLKVNGKPMGSTIEFPEGGGVVTVEISLSSPYALRELQLVHNGVAISGDLQKAANEGIYKWTIRKELSITESGWIAAWGKGLEISAQKIDAMAHTNAVRLIVGGSPLHSRKDARALIDKLEQHRNYYQVEGIFKTSDDRLQATTVFARAIEKLEQQL